MFKSVAAEQSSPTSGPKDGSGMSVGRGSKDVKSGRLIVFWQHSMLSKHDATGIVSAAAVGAAAAALRTGTGGGVMTGLATATSA